MNGLEGAIGISVSPLNLLLSRILSARERSCQVIRITYPSYANPIIKIEERLGGEKEEILEEGSPVH